MSDSKLEFKNKGIQLVRPDLHGNALLFLRFLLENNVLSLEAKNYEAIRDIYNKKNDELTKQDIEKITRLIGEAKRTDKAISMITLLGDTLADRGANDYFNLLIYEKLKQEGIPYEILLSNHDIKFIKNIEERNGFFSK